MVRQRRITKRQFRLAQGVMRRRPVRARRMDLKKTYNVTRKYNLWRKHPGRYDIRGIDTRRRRRRSKK